MSFPVFQKENFSADERILIVEVNWLGDVLFSTPAIRAVRKKHSGAYITALVHSRCKPVLDGNNYLDEVMVLDEEGRHKGLRGKLRLVRELRVRRFSVAYLFKPSLTRALCVLLAGIPVRIGYAAKRGAFLLTKKVVLPKMLLHRADTFCYLVTETKIPSGERYCDFFLTGEDTRRMEEFLKTHHLGQSRRFVVLHAGGNWDKKRWPKENFIRLIDALVTRYEMDVVLTGSALDYPYVQEMAQAATHKPFNACGLTTLKQLGVLFQKSELVISADSGPLHIAMATRARTIALFGPTSPDITGPLGEGEASVLRGFLAAGCIIPCYHLECQDNICMRSISVEQVLNEIEKWQWLK